MRGVAMNLNQYKGTLPMYAVILAFLCLIAIFVAVLVGSHG